MKKNKKKIKSKLLLALILIFFIGLLIVLYPKLSNFIFSISLHNEIKSYESKVSVLSNDDFDEKFKSAKIFNESLLKNSLENNNSIIENTNYRNLLSIDDSGIMGYLVISKIDVNIPIYHGSDKNTLQKGIGHYEGTSLPIDGESVHAVLVGHTGLPSAKIISDLDKMEIGDTFEIKILNKVHEYKVDQIKIVLPNDLSELRIITGKQYVTIVTCTPYGINSHRLLVRGEKVQSENIAETHKNKNEINRLEIFIFLVLLMIFINRIGILQLGT